MFGDDVEDVALISALLINLGSHAYGLVSLKRKDLISVTPLREALKALDPSVMTSKEP